MTLRLFRANRHSIILEIEADTPSDDPWEFHSLQYRDNTNQIKLLLEAATQLEGYIPVLNSSAVVGMPSNNLESHAGTSIFDLLVPKGFDWPVYQEDTLYSDEYIKSSEISAWDFSLVSLIIDLSRIAAMAPVFPELSSVEENETPDMQNKGNDIKNSTQKNFK
jgi:hypothetical protein